jgi:tetratricopeptide (TPR) repeat protein
MKRIIFAAFLLLIMISGNGLAQVHPADSAIDLMLIKGEYKKVVDTCKLILAGDSINPDIYYRLGEAYQNLLFEDKAFDSFNKAASLAPENSNYNFTLAKSYISRGKPRSAEPILQKLCASDTMNWAYSFYLTGIYMQEAKYDESIEIYTRFLRQDSLNPLFIDKIGFACLRKGYAEKAIDMFSRSLEINNKNLNAIKNLSYLYAISFRIDTALYLLSEGIKIDSADADLYARRGALYFSINYNKKALNDYLKILSTGDSSFIYLKRAGIGYSNNLQPKEAIPFLVKAYDLDPSDMEVCSFLARNYKDINDLKNSIIYFKHIVEFLKPTVDQLGMYYILLAETEKAYKQYTEAINYYLKSQELRSDDNIIMIVANLYDEKLKDVPKALRYYELFLEKQKNLKRKADPDYIESIRKRIEALKKPAETGKTYLKVQERK